MKAGWLKRLVSFLPTVPRLLVGFMLISSGWTWLHRPESVAYLADTLTFMISNDQPLGFYASFLSSVVLPNVAVFAFLVSWGEFLSGLSLFFGVGSRVGAAVASFQFLNYGFMGGYDSLGGHGLFIALVAVTVYWKSGRYFGLDRWLYRRWPRAVIW